MTATLAATIPEVVSLIYCQICVTETVRFIVFVMCKKKRGFHFYTRKEVKYAQLYKTPIELFAKGSTGTEAYLPKNKIHLALT